VSKYFFDVTGISEDKMNRKILRLFVVFMLSTTLMTVSAVEHKEYFESGKNAYKNEQYKEAYENFKIAVANSPGTAKYHYNLGLAARKLNYYWEAYDAFLKAQELDPGIGFTNKRDEFFKKLDEMKVKAGRGVGKPAQPSLSHKEYFESGKKAYQEKQYNRAYEFFKKAIALEPGVAKYHYNLGNAARKIKNHREAYEAYLKAQELDPDIEFTNKRDEFFKKLEEAKYQVDSKVKSPIVSAAETKEKKKGGFPIVPFAGIGGIILLYIIARSRRKARVGAVAAPPGEDLLENDRSRVVSSTQYVHDSKPRFWKKRKYRDSTYDDHRLYDDHTRDHGYKPATGVHVGRYDHS
jgi:tetratricopeptide (TPR) repeat protein